MKIISKFHDYYDSAAAYGVSEQFWKRSEEKSLLKLPDIEEVLRNADRSWGGNANILLFCGQRYALMDMRPSLYAPDNFLITQQEDFKTYRELREKAIQEKSLINWPKVDLQPRYISPSNFSRLGFDAYQRQVNKIDAEALHRQFDSPIILLTLSGGWPESQLRYQDSAGVLRHQVTVSRNVSLKDLGFQKVKDAFTAYQEIDSYLSGVLGVQVNPTVEISDTHRLEGHGFDKVTSFRNMKR
jgi:hypothetical protein